MRAPLSLIVPAAVLGVVFPAVFRMAAVESDRPVLAALLYLVGCAVIPRSLPRSSPIGMAMIAALLVVAGKRKSRLRVSQRLLLPRMRRSMTAAHRSSLRTAE